MTAFDTFLMALSRVIDFDGVLGDEGVEFPPRENVDYWATPQNAVVFGWMGVDGVHYAILKIDGQICETSPVIQIGPMDFDEPYSLLAPTFMDYLARGCGVTTERIQAVLNQEESGNPSLLAFMRSHFQQSRFWTDRVECDIGQYNSVIIRKSDCEPGATPDAAGAGE
jgi:hypothetical protein